MRARIMWASTAIFLIVFGSPTFADTGYPNRPIHLIISYPAGTATDTLARIVGIKLEAALGHPVVIDIKTGGAGNIGLATAAKSAPDGYTLTIGGAAMCINASIYGDKAVDPLRDFAPVAKLATTPVIIVASPASHIETIADLVARARREPGNWPIRRPVSAPHARRRRVAGDAGGHRPTARSSCRFGAVDDRRVVGRGTARLRCPVLRSSSWPAAN
jgi:tripartite-type tricarboxylate transporter receptor subunit TctC